MKDWVKGARALREVLLADRHRPRYHIVTPEGTCAPFDPNGALYWRGRYHLMYIIQTPQGHAWAHISSRDLLHWRHHPLALEPGGVDSGIFSGGAFVDKNGVPTITYWGLGEKAGICMAQATDENLDHWEKSPHNPIIHQTRFGYSETEDGRPYGVADPSQIWIRDGRYYLMTGNLLVLKKYGQELNLDEHKGDRTYLFRSDDLVHWTYLHEFYQSDRKWTRDDEDDMCPDFFPLGDRHMLLFISHNLGCQYYLGQYRDDRFHPERHGRMTWVDNAYFAPESLEDDRGRRIMWAWLHDGLSKEAKPAWSGTLSLPRVLSLAEDKSLRISVPEELFSLRGNPRRNAGLVVEAGAELPLPECGGVDLELELEIDPGSAERCGVKVCCSPDGVEQTAIYYDRAAGTLAIDTTRSSLGDGPKSIEAGPLQLAPGEPLRLRVFIDRSVLEVFANDRQAVMRRIYPSREDSTGVVLFSQGGQATVKTVTAWDIAPTNPW